MVYENVIYQVLKSTTFSHNRLTLLYMYPIHTVFLQSYFWGPMNWTVSLNTQWFESLLCTPVHIFVNIQKIGVQTVFWGLSFQRNVLFEDLIFIYYLHRDD